MSATSATSTRIDVRLAEAIQNRERFTAQVDHLIFPILARGFHFLSRRPAGDWAAAPAPSFVMSNRSPPGAGPDRGFSQNRRLRQGGLVLAQAPLMRWVARSTSRRSGQLTETQRKQAVTSPCRWRAPTKPKATPVLMGLAELGQKLPELIGAGGKPNLWRVSRLSLSHVSRDISSRPIIT